MPKTEKVQDLFEFFLVQMKMKICIRGKGDMLIEKVRKGLKLMGASLTIDM